MINNLFPSEIDRKKIFSFFSFLSATLTILLLVDLVQQRPPENTAILQQLVSNKDKLLTLAALVLFWAVFSIPLVIASGIILRQKSSSLAFTASLLSSAGILLLGFGVFIYLSAFLSIITISTDLNQVTSEYQALFWKNLSFYFTDPGLMTWGFGQLLLGWLNWKSNVLPNWLAIAGMIGGAAGLLTLFVYQTGILVFFQILQANPY